MGSENSGALASDYKLKTGEEYENGNYCLKRSGHRSLINSHIFSLTFLPLLFCTV